MSSSLLLHTNEPSPNTYDAQTGVLNLVSPSLTEFVRPKLSSVIHQFSVQAPVGFYCTFLVLVPCFKYFKGSISNISLICQS